MSPAKSWHRKVAIFAVDPGTTSGVARGVFELEPESVWEGLTNGKWESWEVEGLPSAQAWEIMGEYADWVGGPSYELHRERGITKSSFVMEDFVVRLGPGAASRRELLDPVRVANSCETLGYTKDGLRWCIPHYQQPSQAKSFATNDRLRRHGMWVKGSEHRRDAVRHLCTRYAELVGH